MSEQDDRADHPSDRDAPAPSPRGGSGMIGSLAADPREPRIRLASGAIVLAVLLAGVGAATFAALITHRIVGSPAATGTGDATAAIDPVTASLAGSLAAILAAVPILAAIQPWRVRAAGTWAAIWLGSTVGRLLLTPIAGLAVYSAIPGRTDVFLLSLAGTYLACLAAEVAIAARSIARSLAAADANARQPPAS
ncbi:MAG: hypothetical protein KF724_08350 [Phycisphaeraceae bacterium]|nr:hypothetical protein [Phycisphaeraceae bacterium]